MGEKKQSKKPSKNIKIAIISVIVIILISMIGYFTYMNSYVKNWEGKIYPGVKIEGVDISGKNKDEAKKLLKEKYSDLMLKRKINVTAGEEKFTLDFSSLNLKYNTDEAINNAYNYGKGANMMSKYATIKKASNKDFKLKLEYDNKKLKDFIQSIGGSVNKEPINATLKLNNGFEIVQGSNGKKVNSEKLEKDITSKIEDIKNGDIVVKAPIEEVKPRILAENLKLVNAKISTFDTNYGGISSPQRANNIILATKSINGKVLLPGDTFSFNEVVGERTAARGYQEAGILVGNQPDTGTGGGICQVSSTLYNAVLRANIKATERVHHTLPSHYVPLGMDATVDYGNIDYKFTNTLEYPVYIEGVIGGGNVVFNIYSNSAAVVNAEIVNEVYGTFQPNIKYVDDPNIPAGSTESVQSPSTGYKVKVYKKIYKNGALVSNDLVSDDFYRPVDGVIKQGTKK